ncbi:retrovirus-related pol polyprotein from transposon TNT 1-94 [Tanacetum coccineum]
MACDVSWKAKLSTLHDENVLLKHQVESTVKERENIKLEFQRLFNSIKATRAQHQNEITKMIENVNQKTYDYVDVRAQNQDLLMTISELRAKNVSNTKVTSDRPNPVTSQSTSIIERKQQHNANVIERGVYKLNQQDTNTPDSKVNINVSNSTVTPSDIQHSAATQIWGYYTRHALTRKSSVKRALFTSPVVAKSKGLGATSVVEKSRFSVAKTPTTTNKVSSYEDYVQGNLTICHVYYVEGLGHNLFSVRQFCDEDLEVAFRSNTCYVRNLEGDDLLTGSRDSNLYTISIFEMAASFLVCLMSRTTSTKSWLWHRRLSHLNFGTINQLTSHDLVDGLPKFKYHKNHLCSACEQGKSKKASLPPKLVPSTESKLELLHMDLCGPMRVTSINGKKYILVIVDDYSWYTWVYFLITKDAAPDMIIDFVNQV